MNDLPKMPQRVYFAAAEFGDLGLGMAADLSEDLDHVLLALEQPWIAS